MSLHYSMTRCAGFPQRSAQLEACYGMRNGEVHRVHNVCINRGTHTSPALHA
jgi:hypothetical protein